MFDPKKNYAMICGNGPVYYEQDGKFYSPDGTQILKEKTDGLPKTEGKTEAEVIEPEAPPPETPEFEVPPEIPVETRAQRRRGRKPNK